MKIQVTGLDRIMQRVNRYLDIEKKLDEVARRLCEIGEPIIRDTHGHHADVRTEPIDHGYKIVAEGKDVLFIEFGAGDKAGAERDKYVAVPDVVRPGSWSETHAQQYSTYGFWIFGGRTYTETPPHPSFYEAYEARVLALPEIAKDVFK